MRSPRGGFTLIEMLVVVVILGIGLALAIPRIRLMTMRQQVDRTTQIVASDIRSAFTSAARGRVPVRISIASGSMKYAITNRVTGDTIVRRDFSSGDLHVAGGITGSATTVDAFPNGIASRSDTITITGSGYSRKISVSRIGFVRVLP